jgi:hypothetical protein
MWTYEIGTGRLYAPDKSLAGVGYSGSLADKNNPQYVKVKNCGPLPPGRYTIGPAYEHVHCGPVTMDLTPASSNVMYGRSGFKLHGDARAHPGEGSEGCIVQSRHVRLTVNASEDRDLQVVPWLEDCWFDSPAVCINTDDIGGVH